MSYDLHARNKKVDSIRIGAFSWPIILQETGMGHIIGYGAGRTPATYVYQTGNHGSPASNDGYRINAFEAKAMARCGRGFVSVQRFINKEWDELLPEERATQENWKGFNGERLYKPYIHEDRLKQIEDFCTFAEESQGFIIT